MLLRLQVYHFETFVSNVARVVLGFEHILNFVNWLTSVRSATGCCITTAFEYYIDMWSPPSSARTTTDQSTLPGAALLIAGTLSALMGIVWSARYSSTYPHFVAPLVVVMVSLAVFVAWETFGNAKHPLTKPQMFAFGRGRDCPTPVILVAKCNMFYYSSSILWPNMIVNLCSYEGADWKYFTVLSLIEGLAITFGSILLTRLGGWIKHWHLQMTVSVDTMVWLGALCALATPSNKVIIITFMFICHCLWIGVVSSYRSRSDGSSPSKSGNKWRYRRNLPLRGRIKLRVASLLWDITTTLQGHSAKTSL